MRESIFVRSAVRTTAYTTLSVPELDLARLLRDVCEPEADAEELSRADVRFDGGRDADVPALDEAARADRRALCTRRAVRRPAGRRIAASGGSPCHDRHREESCSREQAPHPADHTPLNAGLSRPDRLVAVEAVRILAAVVGGLAVVWALLEAVRAFVIPRGIQLRSRVVFYWVFRLLRWVVRLRGAVDREAVDEIMVYGAPMAVLVLPLLWLVTTLLGFAGIFWAIDGGGFGDAVIVSGSSLFTLGFDRPDGVGGAIAAFACATIGLGLLALVITYLPTLNAAFSRRESVVAMLDTRAGTPPERDHAHRAAPRLCRDRDARRALARVGAVDRRRRGDALHASDARLLPLVGAEPLVGDGDGDADRGGELPALGDRGAGSGERGRVDVLPRRVRRGAAAARRSSSTASRIARSRRSIAASSSAFSSASRRRACPSRATTSSRGSGSAGRRAEYEPILDALARLVDAPAGLWPVSAPVTSSED